MRYKAIYFSLFLLIISLMVSPFSIASSQAQSVDEFQTMVNNLGQGSFSDKSKAILALANSNNARALLILQSMSDGKLAVLNSNKKVVILGDDKTIIDAVTGENITRTDSKKITLNNRLRRDLSGVIGQLTLMSPDDKIRQQAAESMLRSRDPENIKLLETAINSEKNTAILAILQRAEAVTLLASNVPEAQKIQAIEIISTMTPRDVVSLLTPYAQEKGALGEAVQSTIKAMEHKLQFQAAGQNIVYGLSLGSVLLLAAIGLAITFGVMGVINMAHGEIVMIGAYTTFMVQNLIGQYAPSLQIWSLLIALPIAFIISGAIGILMERTVIRWLYGRSLETLLATWGVSLILQQAVRSLFGATNREVSSPIWMSGAYDFFGMSITASRLWIIVFSLAVFVFLLLLMKRSFFGLQMRAVTQNRKMANAMGIRSPYVDALTFGLGSGIAGLAGVALSQIDNVSPNLGQTYIIDSFMVVVFGGVGNLWGTFVAAMSLGVANKLLEPFAGAVLGKILLLVFIILFIQKRPRGLFAQKGRSVEA